MLTPHAVAAFRGVLRPKMTLRATILILFKWKQTMAEVLVQDVQIESSFALQSWLSAARDVCLPSPEKFCVTSAR